MTKGERIILAVVILVAVFGAFIWRRQAELLKRQGEMERKQQRNPFMEPATNSNETTTPEKQR